MQNSKNVWVWVGVVVVVLIIIAWIWAAMMQKKPAVSGPTPTVAPQGQLVPQFPKELILDANASVNTSYALNYASSTNQYTATYTSSSTVASLFKSYQSYFTKNGWTIAGTLNSDPAYNALSATSTGNQVEVVISKQQGGTQVTVTDVVQ